MNLNPFHWRPITFEGVPLPASAMAMTVLMDLPGATEEMQDWLWAFRHCCGMTKRMEAAVCRRDAGLARDLLLDHRARALDEIAERLGSEGFEPVITYSQWLSSLQAVADLSARVAPEALCTWSAPAHADDPVEGAADARRMLAFLDALAVHEEGNPDRS